MKSHKQTPQGEQATLMLERDTDIDPNGYKVVSVRMREAEYVAFVEQIKSLGLTSNLALRIAARRIGGFLEVDSETRRLLQGIISRIGAISRDINRLHEDYASSQKVDMEGFNAQRLAFDEEFAKLDTQLCAILNISRRRADGRLLLRDAAIDGGGRLNVSLGDFA